jgi:hypothetical protein
LQNERETADLVAALASIEIPPADLSKHIRGPCGAVMAMAQRVQRVESNEVATPHHVCLHCGQRMLMRHGVRLPPRLADLFDMIERSKTRGVLCEVLAWTFLSGQGGVCRAALRRRQYPPPQRFPRADQRPRHRRQGRADRQAVPGGATNELEQRTS